MSEVEFAPELQSVKKLSTVDYIFRRFPNWIVESGLLSVLQGNTAKVFLVLLSQVNFNTNCGKLSNKTLARLSGVTQKFLYRPIKELLDCGLLTNYKTGWVRHYSLNIDPTKTYKYRDYVLKESSKRKIPKKRVRKIPNN
ncbi:MAG: hypothetical protein WC390_09175 [Sulfurimonas sp.]|jgi:hypothetical protein